MAEDSLNLVWLSPLLSDASSRPLRRIGMGHCGSVWANPDATLRNDDVALKREDGGPGRSLANEHAVHVHILDALRALGKRDDALGRGAQINMPFCHGFVDTWASILPNLPAGYTRCNALASERIPPMAPAVRWLLVDRYCPKALRDAKDVEFVLAPCRKLADGASSPELGRGAPFTAGQLGQHALWVLEFDCCRSITLDQDGVGQAVIAFYRNDPFYPLPGRPNNSVDAALWQVFCNHYLGTSQKLLADESPDIRKLPSLFIEQLVQRAHGFRTSPLA